MLSDISQVLMGVVEKRRLKDKLEQDLNQVQRKLQIRTQQLAELEQHLKKEQVDVDRLERLSLTGLFYTVLGSKEQQVEKERQDLLGAQLKYQQAKREVEVLQADQGQLKTRLLGLAGVEDEYAVLLRKKETVLRQANAQVADELMRLSEQIANHNAEVREIEEAVTAARAVQAGLDQVIEALESAEGWGTWDMLGGGMISTAIKHSRIDQARAAVQEVQARMSRFTRELADVQQSTDFNIEISGLDIFADYFFDSLIMDWIVQSKIQDSLERSRQARKKIAEAMKALENGKNQVQAQLQHLNDQRAARIEQA